MTLKSKISGTKHCFGPPSLKLEGQNICLILTSRIWRDQSLSMPLEFFRRAQFSKETGALKAQIRMLDCKKGG